MGVGRLTALHHPTIEAAANAAGGLRGDLHMTIWLGQAALDRLTGNASTGTPLAEGALKHVRFGRGLPRSFSHGTTCSAQPP